MWRPFSIRLNEVAFDLQGFHQVHRRGPNHVSTHIDLAVQVYFVLTIAIAPLYFGGDRLLAWGIIGTLQSALYCFISVYYSIPNERSRISSGLQSFGALLILGILLWAILQIILFPNNPFAHNAWELAQPLVEAPPSYPISVTPDEGYLTLVKAIVVILTLLNARSILGIMPSRTLLLQAIAITGTLYAILGLYWVQAYPGSHIWLNQSPYGQSVVSTFVNRNSFAEYLGLCSLCALMLAIRSWRRMPKKAKT